MKRSMFVPALLVAGLATLGLGPVATAAPAVPDSAGSGAFSVPPEKNPPAPGSVDAKPGKALGPTAPYEIDAKSGLPKANSTVREDPDISIVATTPYCSGGLVYVTVVNNEVAAKQVQLVMRANGQARFFYAVLQPGQRIYAPFYGISGNYQVDLNIFYPTTGIYLHDETQYGINACALHPSVACNSAAGTVDVTLVNQGTSFMTTRTARQVPLPVAYWDDRPPGLGNGSVVRTVPVKSPGGSPVDYVITLEIVGVQHTPWIYTGTC
jgi:hypothetical protein